MDLKKLFSVFILMGAETLVIICFLYFGHNLDPKILALNICVTTIILLLLYLDIILPRINLRDESQKAIGTLGLRGVVAFIYMFLAIGCMISFNIDKVVELNTQIIVHAILLLILLVGLYYMMATSDKVGEVYTEEKTHRSHINEMKKITKEVQLKLDQMNGVPSEIVERINHLQDKLRFISPSDNKEAFILETDYINNMKTVWDSIFNIPLNTEKIIELIKNCESVYKERKQQYSK